MNLTTRFVLPMLAMLVAGHIEPNRVADVVIIEASWSDCNGGVLPDQVDVPEPEPMP